jgi:DNA topoisomerase-1
MTIIERLQTTGIRRLGNPKRGFRYRHATGEAVSRADLERIRKLRIPPAWSEVAISAAVNGRVQAIGKDAAGRWQYLYHENFVRQQELKKFRRIVRFAESLPQLRRTINRDMRGEPYQKEKVLACILRILSTCFMRPGSEVYANENGSYGIATLRRKHINVKRDMVLFDFPGKSGVRQQRELKDKRVALTVKSLLNVNGKGVFKYKNGNGEFVAVHGRQINQYIKEVMGEKFSAKDFRTWAGTLVCASALARAAEEASDNRRIVKRKVVEAIKETAEVLGNTPAVCRSSYICPAVINNFPKRIIKQYFSKVDEIIRYRGLKLHPAEKSLLRFLKNGAQKSLTRSRI